MKLNTKLILLTLCIAIPVLAALTYTGIRNNRAQLDEILVEKQAEVQVSVSQIDSLLDEFLAELDDAGIGRIIEENQKQLDAWLNDKKS